MPSSPVVHHFPSAASILTWKGWGENNGVQLSKLFALSLGLVSSEYLRLRGQDIGEQVLDNLWLCKRSCLASVINKNCDRSLEMHKRPLMTGSFISDEDLSRSKHFKSVITYEALN